MRPGAAPKAAISAVLIASLLALGPGCKDEKRDVPQVQVEPIHPDPSGTTTAGGHTAGGVTTPPTTGGEEPDPVLPATGPTIEREPNDSRATATLLPINGGLRASLSKEDGSADVDWYVLTLDGTTSQQARIQLSPEDNSDYALEWMPAEPPARPPRDNPEGRLAAVNNGKAGGVEVLPPTVLPPGRHYFRVVLAPRRRGQRQTDLPERPYRLTTTIVDPESSLEQEPNDTIEEAGILRPNEPREGYLGWHKDADWFRLDLGELSPNAILRVDVTAIAGVKTRLWMVDKQRKGLVKVPEARLAWAVGRPVTIRDVGIVTANAPYYVEVRTMRSANPHERYSIRLQAEEPETAHEREPNWRISDASVLTTESPVDGYLGHPTDWDMFRIDASEAMMATVVITGVPGVDVQMELIDGSRKVVGTVNEAPAGAPETYPLIPVGPQPAFLRVSSKDQAFNVEQGYRMALTLAEAGNREIEPNDDFAGGGRVVLPLDTPFKGFLHPRGDVDHFALDVTADTPDESRILTVRLTGVEGLTLALYLYDSDHALITKKGGIGAGDTRTITHGFTPGRYIIRVRDESGQAANGNDAYLLEVTE